MKKPMSKSKKIIYDILFVIALAVFLFSAYKPVSYTHLLGELIPQSSVSAGFSEQLPHDERTLSNSTASA